MPFRPSCGDTDAIQLCYMWPDRHSQADTSHMGTADTLIACMALFLYGYCAVQPVETSRLQYLDGFYMYLVLLVCQ